MRRTVDLVLPVNPRSQNDGRRVRIAMSSLVRYLDPASVGRLLLVVPDHVPKQAVRALTWEGNPVPFPTVVLNDRELLGVNAWRERVGSWYTQQFVKIGAADHLQSDYYVTLDSDVVLTKPTGFDDLVIGGRAATLEYGRDVHENWWRASAQVLGTEPRLERDGMGVTPAVLSTRIARGLMRYLEKRHAGPWYRGVVEFIDDQKARGLYAPHRFNPSPTPTEYTLYYLFAEMSGTVSSHHVRSGSLWCGEQVFRPDELRDLASRLNTARSSIGRFFVLQSVLGASPEWVWSQVAEPFDLAAPSRRPTAAAGESELATAPANVSIG
jgi:Family of unknown function (DUF6492)